MISHDQRFLDNVVTHILDVDYETILSYPGNYTEFVEEKAQERDRKEAEIEKREAEIAHHKAFVDRFEAKATKARQAKSKLKQIERIVIEQLPQTSRRYPTFKFVPRRPSGQAGRWSSRASRRRTATTRCSRTSRSRVQRGDRLAIIGPNGIGKSTLLKIAMGVVPADAGKVEWGYETWPGYFAQDHREVVESSEQTVEAWFWELVPARDDQLRARQAGRGALPGTTSRSAARALRRRGGAARLRQLSVQQPNVLVLDEPTNHLDLEAIEALVDGLEAYDGTLLFVSHDRWFVSRLATRILEITPNGIRDFPGTYDEYLARCGDDHLDADAVLARARQDKKKEKEAKRAGSTVTDAETQKRARQLERDRDRLTAEIDKAEHRVHAINELFCNPGFFDKTSPTEVKKLENEQKTLSARLEELMSSWEKVEKELESLAAPV